MPSKLLLVEDDEANLETAASFLQRRNYQVVARPGVAGAMRALESDPEIGLVVTDLRMPGLDGFAIIRGAGDLAQKTGRTVPVTVMAPPLAAVPLKDSTTKARPLPVRRAAIWSITVPSARFS